MSYCLKCIKGYFLIEKPENMHAMSVCAEYIYSTNVEQIGKKIFNEQMMVIIHWNNYVVIKKESLCEKCKIRTDKRRKCPYTEEGKQIYQVMYSNNNLRIIKLFLRMRRIL